MSNIVGVGFLLFLIDEGSLKIFTVKELKSKPELHKKNGMVSFPLETYKKEEDGNYCGTIIRLLREEVGIPSDQVRICDVIPDGFNLIPKRRNIWTYYGYGVFLGDPDQSFVPDDNDVVFAGWKSLLELSACSLRIEVIPILKHFLLKGHYEKLLRQVSVLDTV